MPRLSTAGLLLLVACSATFVGPTPSRAQENPEAALYQGWDLSRVRVDGLPSEHASRVRSGLILTETSGLIRKRYGIFYPEVLEEDVRRIRLYLARNGYPHARIETRFIPHPQNRRLGVTIEVDPGPLVLVEEVVLDGFPSDLNRRARRVLTLENGGAFSEGSIVESQAELIMVLRDGGYARATVEPAIEEVTSDRVRVRFLFDPGRQYVFGEIQVEGVSEDLIPLAKRTINLRPGDRYSAQSLTRAHENLRLLNLFRQVRLSTKEAAPGTLDVQASLSEREPRTIEIRGGYWSQDRFRGRFAWQHRNPFGRGRGVGYYITASKYLLETEASMWWPALIAPRTREAVALLLRNEKEDNYTQLGVGAEVSSTFRPTLRTTLRGAAAVTYVEVDEDTQTPELDTEGIIVPVTGSWRWDTSDNPLIPTRGKILWDELKYAIPGISENEFIRNEAGVNLYFPVLRQGVLATRMILGLAKPLGSSIELTPSDRFYAGGTNSNRGFDRRKLGPLNEAGDPVGGRVSVVTMTELRFRLFWQLEGAVFLDVGQVWSEIDHVKISDLEPSIGPALMIRTPVGPVRVDYGFRLKDSGSLPDKVFHFAIGHPF